MNNQQYQIDLIFNDYVAPRKGSKIPFGIHSNCKVKSLEFKAGEYTDINFEDSEGRYHNKRLWYPNGKYLQTIKLPDGTTKEETTDEAMLREGNERLAHIVKLLHIFLSESELANFPRNLNYDQFTDQAIKLLTPKLASKKVNLKLIYDSEGMYSVFGNFPDYIETFVEGEEPKLQFSNWEKENRCTYKGGESAPSKGADIDGLFK